MARSFNEIPVAGVRSFGDIPTTETESFRSFGDIGAISPIGYIESLLQDPETKIPFSPAAAAKALNLVASARRLQADNYDITPIEPPTPYPHAIGSPQYDSQAAHRAFIKEASTPHPIDMRNRDIEFLTNYFEEQEERSRRGYSLGGKVGAISSQIPALALEFWATGGLKKIGSEAVKKAATKSLRRYATTNLGKAAIATGGAAAGVSLRAAGLPHRAVEAVAKRQVPRSMKINDDGSVEIEGPVEGVATSVIKGLADHWITIAAEQSGEAFGPAFKKSFSFVGKKLPIINKLLPRMQKAWLSKASGRTVAEFNKKVATVSGFHGTLSELGEEWVDNNTKAILNIDNFGAGDDASWQQRITAANKNFTDNLPAMVLAFAPLGAARGLGGLGNIPIQEQIKKREAAQTALQQMHAQEIDAPTQIETAEGSIGYDSGFFAEKYQEQIESGLPQALKEAGVGKYFTPKWLVNRLVGAETLLEDVEAAHTAQSLERSDWQGWINSIVKKLKKEKELTRLPGLLSVEAKKEGVVSLKGLLGGEAEIEREEGFLPAGLEKETRAHILQKKIGTRTNPVQIMRDLLDTYEDAPSFLSESEANIFNQVRSVTRYMLDRVNRARTARGEAPIEGLEAYITHWMDAAVEDTIANNAKGRRGILGSAMTKVSKKIPNTTAERRKLRGDIEQQFSKDLGKVLQQMIKYDLRDIHITTPYQTALAELNALDKMGLVPASTYRTIEDYLRYDIREFQAPLDKLFNNAMKKPADLLARLTFGKVAIDDPAKQVLGSLRKLSFMSGLGFRAKSPLRNLGQRMLLQDLYRGRDYAKAQAVASRLAKMPQVEHPQTGEMVDLYDLIREQDWYKMTLQKFEDITADADTVRSRFGDVAQKVQDASFHAYSRSHAGNLFLSNVEVAALTGYFDWQYNYEQSKPGTNHFKKTMLYSVQHGINQQQLLTGKEDMMWSVREAVRRTQWEYFATSMPTIYRGQVARAGLQFQSWLMNYYFNHTREMASQLITGRNSKGRLIPGAGRLRALKGVGTITAMGKLIEGAFGIAVLKFLLFPDLSQPLSAPIPNFILSVAAYWGADDEKEKKAAWRQVKRALKFWAPYSLAVKDMWEVLSGEQDFDEVLFYKKRH